jgi:cytochrome oxidase Cu insertion factor (SCO1/SenC/PrrC family)
MNNKLIQIIVLCALFIYAPALFVGGNQTHVHAEPQQQQGKKKAVRYSCPMHPEVASNKPGRCPKCGMNLKAGSGGDNQKANGSSTTNVAATTVAATEKKTDETNLKLRIPDTPVYDQNNRKLNFYTDLVKGKTVVINFIFTTCTTICPPLTATFRRVQQTLGERAGRDIQLISISVDPTTDVPARLKSFSEKFKAGPGWTFVTGNKQDVDRLLSALGGYVPDKNDHTPLILIGNDAAGSWTRTYGLAPASQIVNLVNDAAGKAAPSASAGTAKQTTEEAETKNAMAEAASKYFPNLVLLTQDNKPVRFYADLLKGKVVLINFLFTNCKGVCSPMTANLAKVQKYLGERVGREVLMISVSVDPLTDTPAVLKKYADSFKAQPGWYFLTGDKKNVDWVLYKMGGYVEKREEHSSVLIIGNEATGEWMKVHAMANPVEIANAVTKLLASTKETN